MGSARYCESGEHSDKLVDNTASSWLNADLLDEAKRLLQDFLLVALHQVEDYLRGGWWIKLLQAFLRHAQPCERLDCLGHCCEECGYRGHSDIRC